jgi:hypothetical protein
MGNAFLKHFCTDSRTSGDAITAYEIKKYLLLFIGNFGLTCFVGLYQYTGCKVTNLKDCKYYQLYMLQISVTRLLDDRV